MYDNIDCFIKFSSHKNWYQHKFKILKNVYPKFDFPANLVNIVNAEQFLETEPKVLPLFLGSQFGMHPNPEEIFYDNDKSILVAILNKSLLSGHVSGLSISSYSNLDFKEIEFFAN